MRIEGHYDRDADIAWLRFEGYAADRVVGEEVDFGLREFDPHTGSLTGLEYWRASDALPDAFLSMLPPPQVAVDA